MTENSEGTVDPKLLEILRCPIGLAELRPEGDRLICTRCGTKFRVEPGGIPNMLIEEAELPPGVSDHKELPCWAERHGASAP